MKHRIPGMIVTDKGTLIVYNEARMDASDWAAMDIFMQRSTDCGRTFGEPIYLAYGTEEHKTVNNPVMVQDKNSRIHFLHCQDYGIGGGRILRQFSDDDGLTWSETFDITDVTLPLYRNVIALGPGHGIMTPDGTLLIPVWMVPKLYEAPESAHGPSVISTLYSKDNGESWQMGEILASSDILQNPNETEMTLLSDGRVYLNARCDNHWRATAVSLDGYTTWQGWGPDKSLHDPKCFGSVSSYAKGDYPYTIIFANCESKVKRRNVTVKGSADNGRTWTLRRVIDPDRGGYVECAVDNVRGLIYVLYEHNRGESCHLAVFNYEWLNG